MYCNCHRLRVSVEVFLRTYAASNLVGRGSIVNWHLTGVALNRMRSPPRVVTGHDYNELPLALETMEIVHLHKSEFRDTTFFLLLSLYHVGKVLNFRCLAL
jgi:hypothetical protein